MKKKFGELTLKEVSIICGLYCNKNCPFLPISRSCVMENQPKYWPLEEEIEIPECLLKP
jgi:hypothetical protein